MELGVALLGLCILQNSIEKPGGTVSCQVVQKVCQEALWGTGPLRGTQAAGPASLWSAGLFSISVC